MQIQKTLMSTCTEPGSTCIGYRRNASTSVIKHMPIDRTVVPGRELLPCGTVQHCWDGGKGTGAMLDPAGFLTKKSEVRTPGGEAEVEGCSHSCWHITGGMGTSTGGWVPTGHIHITATSCPHHSCWLAAGMHQRNGIAGKSLSLWE